MDKTQRQEAVREWTTILKDHPKFARAYLAQQVVLMQASEQGDYFVTANMCALLTKIQYEILFGDYWRTRCAKLVQPIDLQGVLGCLAKSNNPADCFSIPHEDDWFKDPLAGGKTLPPKGPVPPLTGTKKPIGTPQPG